MITSNPISNAMVYLVLVVLIAGASIGLLLGNTDITNFIRNEAVAERIRSETQIELQVKENEIQNLSASRDAELQIQLSQLENQAMLNEASAKSELQIMEVEAELKLQAIQNEYELQSEYQGIYLKFYERVASILIGIIVFFVSIASIWLTFRVLQFFRLESSLGNPSHEMSANYWKDSQYKKQRILLAKYLEAFSRTQMDQDQVIEVFSSNRHSQN